MEAGKSQDLQGESVGWRPRKANAVVPVQVKTWDPTEYVWSEDWEALDPQEPKFQFGSQGREKADVPVQDSQAGNNFPLLHEGSTFFVLFRLLAG